MPTIEQYMKNRKRNDDRFRELETRVEEVDEALTDLPDETAVDAVALFEQWKPGVEYVKDKRIRDGEKLYRVVQTHVSQDDWRPADTPALFTEIAKPGEIPVWKQPIGQQDAYMKGDKVHYPEKGDPVYVSNVDINVWQPGVYGWDLEEQA